MECECDDEWKMTEGEQRRKYVETITSSSIMHTSFVGVALPCPINMQLLQRQQPQRCHQQQQQQKLSYNDSIDIECYYRFTWITHHEAQLCTWSRQSDAFIRASPTIVSSRIHGQWCGHCPLMQSTTVVVFIWPNICCSKLKQDLLACRVVKAFHISKYHMASSFLPCCTHVCIG